MATLTEQVGIRIDGCQWHRFVPRQNEGTQRVDELRNEIFDFLYRAQGSKSIDEIANQVHQDGDTVREAVDHDWFLIAEDQVKIAYGNP